HDPPPPEIYTLSLHDALPILRPGAVLLVRAVRPDGAVRRPPRRRGEPAVARRPGRTHLVGVLAGGRPPGRHLDRRPPPRHAPGSPPYRLRRPGRCLPPHRPRYPRQGDRPRLIPRTQAGKLQSIAVHSSLT